MQHTLTHKFIAIVAITVALLLVLMAISGKITERERYFDEAKDSVAKSWTGHQQVAPIAIAFPYKVPVVSKNGESVQTKYEYHTRLVAPSSLFVSSELTHDSKAVGIFSVPVYTAVLQVKGSLHAGFFNEHTMQIASEVGANNIEFLSPFAVALISDVRGINRISPLQWNDTSLSFSSGNQSAVAMGGVHVPLPEHADSDLNAATDFSFELELRGMESLHVVPTGLQTRLAVKANWPHPKFEGAFLPSSSQVSDYGYLAQWSVTSFASSIENKLEVCNVKQCNLLFQSSMGVSHINPVDIYTQTDRSVKYGILFIGLCFTVFLVFEVLTKQAIHPIQYALVGLANAVFYLLLLSLSEHIYFVLAYLIGAVGCIGVIYLYMKPFLVERFYLFGFVGLLTVLYATLYFIISMEDTALLAGATLSFIVLATVMVLTRHIDWYHLMSSDQDSK